ncbi:MAG: hypothetical protein KAI71_04240 [Candidatus Pacebacteria bacterium]|nr:hypothetical protein [Candidatus Paceibacterota bacterium]
MKKKIKGGIHATIGFILSPLSWWNDLLVNIPLAYIFALPFGLISEKLFLPMIILGYWITNVIGFMLMHHGVSDLVSKDTKKYTKKELTKDILISVVYTIIVILFVLSGFIKFPL